ncbi:MAG TPA: HAD-IA family hydrolase [Verrucomicrobiae bacterium]|nr:HAD-IA family hydrolase [Verrucomicrobiae bacterium]
MKQLIAYDLDGTLVDTRKDIVLSVNHMLESMGAPSMADRDVERCVGFGLRELVRRTLKTDDSKALERGAKIFRAHYEEHMMDHTRLYPGAKDVLEFFKGRRQAVLTNKPNPFSENMLAQLGTASYFCAVLTGDPGKPKKPDPTAFLELLDRERVPPSAALFVGDSGIDFETGRRAGVETVIITHGFVPENELKSLTPDHLVQSFEALLDLARKKSW